MIATTAGTPNFRTLLDMALEIRETRLQGCKILVAKRILRHAAMHLERAHRSDDHCGRGIEARPGGI